MYLAVKFNENAKIKINETKMKLMKIFIRHNNGMNKQTTKGTI